MKAWVLCLALLGAGAARAQDWKPLTAGELTVSFPGDATASTRTNQTQVGEATTQVYQLDQEKEHQEVFSLSVTDYPAEALKKAVPGKLLENARDGLVAHSGGTLEKDVAVTLDSGEPKKKWPGRELVLRTEKGQLMNVRLFLAGSRLYVLMVVRGSDAVSDADYLKFADSFKLKPAPKPGKGK